MKHRESQREGVPAENPQQFLKWFTTVEVEMENDQLERYRLHLAKLKRYKDIYGLINDHATNALQYLDDIKENYDFVQTKSKSLQDTCEALLEEQTKLSNMADLMEDRLHYFNDFDKIMKVLNAPGEDICLNDNFVPTLSRLDYCLAFLEKHMNFKDSELYAMRFKQCMTRALSLIMLYFSTVMQSLSSELLPKASSKDPIESVVYIPFMAIAPANKPLMAEIEMRCSEKNDYVALLKDCYYSYFNVRKSLLNPYLAPKVAQIAQESKGLLDLCKNGCNYLLQISEEEHKLFFNFFDSGDNDLCLFLSELIAYLDDSFRPLLLKENNLDLLVNLCSFMKQTVSKYDEDDQWPLLHVLDKMLQDAQSRVVFRAQNFISQAIEHYKFVPEDLNYPDRLRVKTVTSFISDTDVFESEPCLGWFPTLQNTIYILSKLYLSVNESVFEDLSQEALNHCFKSLKEAKVLIYQSKGVWDASLFFLLQLSVMKNQISPFKSDFIQKERSLDFSDLTKALNSIDIQKVSRGNGIYELVQQSIPKVVDRKSDSKKYLDDLLQRSYDDIVLEVSRASVEPLSGFLLKASAFRLHSSANKSALLESLANERNLEEVNAAFDQCIKNRFKVFAQKAEVYLLDETIRVPLMDTIKVFCRSELINISRNRF